MCGALYALASAWMVLAHESLKLRAQLFHFAIIHDKSLNILLLGLQLLRFLNSELILTFLDASCFGQSQTKMVHQIVCPFYGTSLPVDIGFE